RARAVALSTPSIIPSPGAGARSFARTGNSAETCSRPDVVTSRRASVAPGTRGHCFDLLTASESAPRKALVDILPWTYAGQSLIPVLLNASGVANFACG